MCENHEYGIRLVFKHGDDFSFSVKWLEGIVFQDIVEEKILMNAKENEIVEIRISNFLEESYYQRIRLSSTDDPYFINWIKRIEKRILVEVKDIPKYLCDHNLFLIEYLIAQIIEFDFEGIHLND